MEVTTELTGIDQVGLKAHYDKAKAVYGGDENGLYAIKSDTKRIWGFFKDEDSANDYLDGILNQATDFAVINVKA